MPKHVHALIETDEEHRLDRVVHSWKWFTAHGRTVIWVARNGFGLPNFDRYMRDDSQFAVTRMYIENNPVKANLCANPSDWPHSSAAYR